MRPVSVFANGSGSEIERLEAELRGRWREAPRAVMVLLSAHGLPPAQIAELLDCHPGTVRRWISRFSSEGAAGLAGRPRSGRPALGGRRLTRRIAVLLDRPGPWTLPRIRRYLGQPGISVRTLYRRVRLVAIWRRPKLTARGDPDHDHVVAGIVARLIELPRRAVVLAEDETHLNLLPHVRASWTLRAGRPQIPTPGTNRQVTVFGALEVTTGAWVYRLGRRCAADFIALLDQLLRAFPSAPAIVVICDNDSIHHARTVTAYLEPELHHHDGHPAAVDRRQRPPGRLRRVLDRRRDDYPVGGQQRRLAPGGADPGPGPVPGRGQGRHRHGGLHGAQCQRVRAARRGPYPGEPDVLVVVVLQRVGGRPVLLPQPAAQHRDGRRAVRGGDPRGFTGGQTVRAWLARQRFADQYDFGMEILGRLQNRLPLP